jgi:hypothetical protein
MFLINIYKLLYSYKYRILLFIKFEYFKIILTQNKLAIKTDFFDFSTK